MIDLKKGFLIGLLTFGIIGCSEPEPIDLEREVADAGLSSDDYEVHDNGAIEIKSQVADAPSYNPNDPVATHGDNWQYVVSNAILVADAHAVKNNPSATYLLQNSEISLVGQIGGEYEGEHLLTIVNDNSGDISYVQLRPLFDINKSSDLLEKQLDEETPLWEVTIAKYNGREF